LKKKINWNELTPKEMFEHSTNSDTQVTTRLSDSAVKVGLLLLMPYVMWLSKYSDSYVETIQNKVIHLNFDGIMLTLHNLFTSANLIVHESGHGVCYLLSCPEFITFANGTLFQLALPLIVIFYYKKRHNTLGVGLGLMWLAQNLIYVAWYMSYAQSPNKYPFFLGGSATHDFWYMFSQLGVLEYDWFIAGAVRIFAVMLLLGSYFYLLFSAYFTKNETDIKVYDE